MRILILHRVPYARIDYARGIDHAEHEVTYFGTRAILDTLPRGLPHHAVARAGQRGAYEEALDWLAAQPQQFDRVLSLSEYELLDAARLRERLGVPGPSVEEVQRVRDKVIMKQAVARAGLKVPRHLRLPALLAAPEAASWTGASVLKPHSGASSEDVVVFDSPSTLLAALASRTSGAARLDRGELGADAYEVEEFVTGDILHLDGLVVDGQLATTMASRYLGTCLGYAQGEPLGSLHFPLSDALRDWTSAVLAAVGIRDGSFHLEAIETPDGPVFLEIGNRVGGADVVATFELATGVHLPSEELRVLTGKPPSHALPATQAGSAWHGWFVFPGHALGVAHYPGTPGTEAFRDDPAVVRWAELPPGAPLLSRITYSAHEAPIAGIVACRDADATAAWLRRLFDTAAATRSAERAALA
ncbi:ATP-grasp domain-containing protein [Burkholderia gladioli]|uniref:ATP-grasp domain-containing protein n=1 Tax=Burkholderia gladioli TaxID=28095 RepID=UPI001C23A231|nr:ATP-grasp domain-containing protein [Burkholderia gladioli]MBU9216794.1 ATP-grasp domain-containing protein [Burkholderia gladioli]MDN7722023.1 ATP-grasp domain-containing protein [Burkholderia gladioli]